jgi:hypothetical protein
MAIYQLVKQVCESAGVATKLTRLNNVEDTVQSLSDVVPEALSHLLPFFVDLVYILAENKHVFGATLFCNFDICTIHSANN